MSGASGRMEAKSPAIAITMRVYTGTRDQLPDPKIEAVEGAGTVPAYRGTAYVVIEDLELGRFGNRVPQFTFEVTRPSQTGAGWRPIWTPCAAVRAVALLPGSGEYALGNDARHHEATGPARPALTNVNTPSGKSDLSTRRWTR